MSNIFLINFSETEILAKISLWVIGMLVYLMAAINPAMAIAIAVYFFYLSSDINSGYKSYNAIFNRSSFNPKRDI